MPFLLRLVLLALAGIWLVGARHACQRSETQQVVLGKPAAVGQPGAAISVASRR